MKTLIIVPIKNAYQNILDIAFNIEFAAPGIDYLIVDTGSTDRTKYLLLNNNINRLEMPIETNYFQGLNLGIKYAYDNGYDNCIQLDQSESLDYKDIKYFVKTAENKNVNIILGSRFVDKKMPWNFRFFMTHILRGVIKLFSGKKITDPYLKFKLFDRKIMKEIINNQEWSIDADSVANLIRAGYTYTEIQVNINNKKIRQSTYKGIKLFSYIWNKIISILFVQPFRKRKKVKNAS